MPIFYRGAGLGTYWHQREDPQVKGFYAQHPQHAITASRIINHIGQGTANSPFISLTRSFPVARDYAVNYGSTPTPPTQANPAYVYEIELDAPMPFVLTLIDPVIYLAPSLPDPFATICYQHDGPQTYLIAVVDPKRRSHFFRTPLVQMPHGNSGSRPSLPSPHLKALVCALRDGELLAYGTIPAKCVVNRHMVW